MGNSFLRLAALVTLNLPHVGASITAAASREPVISLQGEFEAAGVALRERLGCEGAGDELCAARAERARQRHQARFLALKQEGGGDPRELAAFIRSPFTPDGNWAAATASKSSLTVRPRWDLYSRAAGGWPSPAWDMYGPPVDAGLTPALSAAPQSTVAVYRVDSPAPQSPLYPPSQPLTIRSEGSLSP